LVAAICAFANSIINFSRYGNRGSHDYAIMGVLWLIGAAGFAIAALRHYRGTSARQTAKRPVEHPADHRTPPNAASQPAALSPEAAAQIDLARQSVKAPATGMIVAAGINIASVIAFGTLGYVIAAFDQVSYSFASLSAIAGLLVAGFMLLSSIRMLKTNGRAQAIIACIVAMLAAPAALASLPVWLSSDTQLLWILAPALIIGLPMGICALVVLNRREVVEAFILSGRNRNMRKSKMSLLIVLLVVLGVGLAGAGAVIHAQGQQNVNLLKVLASAVDRQKRPVPLVVQTTPAAFANDVDTATDKITVTFDRPMMDQSWSWTGGGDTYPEIAGKIHYDQSRTTCTMPVKLQPGKVYWVGVNSPSHKDFKTPDRIPAQRYVILFATRSADGKPTPLPEDLVKRARQINSTGRPAVTGAAATQPVTQRSESQNAVTAAVPVAQAWLALLDEGKIEQSWDQAAKPLKAAITRDKWATSIKSLRQPLGKVTSRKLISATYATSLPGAADGQYVVIQFKTGFDNKPDAVETVTPMLEADGNWRVSGYYIK